MISFPNAKINLGLHIVKKRTDGFHDLETIFIPIPLTDVLEIVPSDTTTLSLSGIEIDSPMTDNLVYKAYALLQQDYNLSPIAIHLHKHIPSGAGLGGGSSDAAFMLKMLNAFFDLKLSTEQLQDYARKLGSDCAFFIENKPTFAFAKGDQFREITHALPKVFVVLVKPQIHVSTKEAYAGVAPKAPEYAIEASVGKEISRWKSEITNDFEKGIFALHPEIAAIKSKLYEMGAQYASMSGSGSSVYGLFLEKPTDLPDFGFDSFVWVSEEAL